MDVCRRQDPKGKKFANGWQRHTEPPKFMVANFIAQDDFVTALDDITMKDEDGKAAHYCTAMSDASMTVGAFVINKISV